MTATVPAPSDSYLQKGPQWQGLSSGQHARIVQPYEHTGALCRHPRLLLLDEPDSSLDFGAQMEFYRLLPGLRDREGLSAVVVSHDLAVLSAHVGKLVCVDRTMHLHGSPAALRDAASRSQRCQYDLLAAGRDPVTPAGVGP